MDDFKNNEIESIKALIMLLAKRGYILKSELECILRGCRHNSFVLDDVEKLMHTCIDDVNYVDDIGTTHIVRTGLELQNKINLLGFEDVYEYLEIESDVSDEEIIDALKKKKERDCDEDVKYLIENNGRQTYEAILRSKEVIEEMQLRQSFNVLNLRQSEYLGYINEIILVAFVDESAAKMLMDGFVASMGFVVERELDKRIDNKEKDNIYLIEEQGQNELDNAIQKNGFRGINNG